MLGIARYNVPDLGTMKEIAGGSGWRVGGIALRVIGRETLNVFCRQHADVRSQVNAWLAEVRATKWHNPADLKERYPSASLLENDRVVFNLKGNKYRLVVKVGYRSQVVRVLKIGTHAEYDKWKL